jgi:type II secretory pathway pseudopilin PulG
MTPKLVTLGLVACLALITLPGATQTKPAASDSNQKALADAAAQKLTRVQRNGMRQPPDQTPTVLTQEELNAYFADGRVKLPAGVKNLRFQAEPGVITANTEVDFDRVKAGQSSNNPLLSIFSGIHDVQVVAHGKGSGGTGRVQIESAAIDGLNVPRFALEMFVDKFIRPKYPQVGLDSQFKMPARVDVAVVGDKKLTLTQK